MNSALAAYDPWLDGFTREIIRCFARVGVYPPPYAGDERNPESVLLSLATQDRWRDPPSLVVSDEDGVELQRRAFEQDVQAGLAKYENRDPAEFGSWHR